jgi:hypothetical protein
MYSEPQIASFLPSEPNREPEPGWRVSFDESRDAPTIGKGQSAESLPRTTLCLDTGTPQPPPENLRHPESQAEIDAVYRETIRRGIIDHHSIDAAADIPADKRRCTTTMIADFPEDVLSMMRERGTTHITSHHESDLDSIGATYLAKSLLEKGKLPSIAAELSGFVNRIDYGRFQENDPEKFLHSLQGAFSACKHVLTAKRDAETGKIWQDQNATRDEKIKLSSLVRQTFQNQLMARMFELLNAAEKQNLLGPGSVDFADFDAERLDLPPELRILLIEGSQGVKDDFRKFEEVFEKAEERDISVIDKQGKPRTVRLLIMDLSQQPELSPLAVTSMAYDRVPPDAIIAVYAGPDRKKGGDHYDIGMKPESTEIFDLKFLERPLNDAEAEKRKPLIEDIAKKAADGRATPEEQATLAKWQALRPGFEHLGHGDPTVSVAGNSLIAASTTSLLDFEDFKTALENARQLNQTQG